MDLTQRMKDGLAKIKAEGMLRELRVITSASGRTLSFRGKEFINFSSNNYLGLSSHPQVIKAASEALEKYGAGGTSSRLIAGTLEIHAFLEEKLAELKKTGSALVFPSGYQANAGIISAVVRGGGCLIMDKLNHASIWDAARLSGARVFVYQHLDMNSLERTLKRSKNYDVRLIATDSVFSMDGDIAPLKDIVTLANKYGAYTMIDEAHSTGVLGGNGRGLAEQDGVEGMVDIVMGTLSKALGSQGGFVCSSKSLIDHLINKSRPFIYTTSLAPAMAAAAAKAVELTAVEPQRREKLLRLSARLREGLKSIGVNTAGSRTQIIPAVCGGLAKTLELSEKLFAAGFFAPAIRPPTVPEGECRLRFSLTSDHSDEDIDGLISCLK